MSTDGSSKSQSAITSSSFPKSMSAVDSTHNGSESSLLNNSGNSTLSSLIHHTDCRPIAEVAMASKSNRLEQSFQLHTPKQYTDKPYGQRAKKSFSKPRLVTAPQQVLGRDTTNPEIEVVEYVTKTASIQESKQSARDSNHNTEKHVGNVVKLNEEVTSHTVKKEISECEETEPWKPSQLSHTSDTLCEQKSDEELAELESAYMNTQLVAESNTPSPVIESEASFTIQSTPGPSRLEMVNGEEMTVTSTTTSHVLGGSIIDEEHRKSILTSMKQAYTSELNQSGKMIRSDKQVNLDDTTEMPALRPLSISIGNEVPLDIDAPRMPVLDMNADDSFDEELNSLAKKSLFSSPDSKTDFGMESQEDLFSEGHSESTGKVALATAPVDRSMSTPNPVQNNGRRQPLDVQDVHHPPTPATTPQTDDLEAAMAALHGEPLDADPVEMETSMTKKSLKSLAVPKVKGEHELISEYSADSDYRPNSGNAEVSSDEVEKIKPPVKPYKFHKIGPKSRTMAKRISKPTKLSPPVKTTGGANYKTKDETKPVVKTKPQPRLSREVENLCADEMVNNILRSIEEQGSSRRRSAQAVTYKEYYQSNHSEKDSRVSRRSRRVKEEELFERESTPPKKKKKTRTSSVPSSIESIPQDRAFQRWEPLENSNNEDRVVYVPRKLVNPSDASKIVQRRSFSSASSTDDDLSIKRKSLHVQDDVESASYALKKDHCYTTVKSETPEPGSSLRGTEDLAAKLSASCHEIHIRCKDHLLYVKLCPRTSKLRNSLNSSILKELSVLLRKLKMEPQIHVVLFTSAGSDFCTGVDFPSLIHDNMASRLEASISLVNRIQEFITELANCDKILVGGLVGSVIGLGVTMLPYMDLVYACDKTTFYLPYVKLGQSSEGGLPLTFPSISKNLLNLLVYEGRRLTATQAKSFGLVDDVFLPDSFQEEMIPRVVNLANLYSQNSLPMKRMSRAALRRDLPAVVKEESQLLRQSWISEDFQRRAKQLFDSGDLLSE